MAGLFLKKELIRSRIQIMKTLCAIGAALLVVVSAQATITFEYSYTFNDNWRVSGSFQGDPIGDLIKNVSNLTMKVNDVAVQGTLRAWGKDAMGGPVFSALVSMNNFAIENSSGSDYFRMMNDRAYVSNPDAYLVYNGRWTAYDAPPVSSKWTLTAVPSVSPPSAVPEPSTLLAGAFLLMPFGIHGLKRLRNRK